MIKLTEKNPDQVRADLLVYFVTEAEDKKPFCQSSQVAKALQQPWDEGDFSGREGQFYQFYPVDSKKSKDDIKARRVLVIGLGKVEDRDYQKGEQLRIAGGMATAQARKCKAAKVVVVLPDAIGLAPVYAAECLAEGLVLGNYQFVKYKNSTDKNDEPFLVKEFILSGPGMAASGLREGLRNGSIAASSACVARDMASEPGNNWTPVQFAEYGKKLARETSLSCTILNKTEMKKLGMGGILAVNQGSAVPPKLVIVQYKTAKKNPTLMLVGKGLTFDSGGISLKPAAGMEDMKYDMCGGAAVLAAMEAVGYEKPAGVNIVALVPATDNMSGSAAIKPGDIISQYNGKTCEVVNTDAEGRLLLADALAYGIEKFKPDAVVDLATLTGAVIVGLGHHRTGLLSNNDNLVAQIMTAGEKSGEPLWRLPLGPEYSKQLKSEVADMKNVGGKGGGTITAAAYLQEFVGDTPWAHLDIAGTAWGFTEKSYVPAKGPSGIGVRTLLSLVRNWQPLE